MLRDKATWEKIRQEYPDEWVVLTELDADEQTHEVRGGEVMGHGKSKRDLLVRLKPQLGGKSLAILFTGEVGRGSFLF